MTTPPLPAPVIRFLEGQVHSIEQLEVLLLLWRERSRTWTAAEVSQALRIDPGSAHERLLDWVSRRFAREQPGEAFQYEPPPGEAADTIAAVAEAYAQRRVTVIELIFSKPSPKLKSFADAFRFKKGDD